MERRRFLAASATITAVVFAGCGSPNDDDDDGGGDGYSLDEPTEITPPDNDVIAR
ncbi:twin-arginine translocation signal domain-containing protein [Natrinema halophilum]|uniref:Twin-arginine translocation signal domain-containing protein n=1 Tax=Natrinema halophilum TaxID=1699371 RepID=A0A7D5GQ25_9EURY|nr:twin-arginine translocation signal domain-containing protein [Natrinema halophilum]QLG51013.1 twin-arginine translocation signal domain-containing protein [Natrinema halophilum]